MASVIKNIACRNRLDFFYKNNFFGILDVVYHYYFPAIAMTVNIKNTIGYLTILLLLISPFVFITSLFDFANLPQTIFIQLGVLVLLLMWCAKAAIEGKIELLVNFTGFIVIAFLIWSFLSLIWAQSRCEGFLTIVHWTICGSLFFLITNCLYQDRWINGIIAAILIAGIGISLLGCAQHIFKWSYEKDLFGTNGSDSVWLDDIAFPESMNPIINEDFETGDLSKFSWITSGDGLWEVTSTYPNSGAYSAEPTAIGNDESANIETMLNCYGGELSFWYGASSEENGDYLNFYIDGILEGAWSGSIAYTKATYSITSGTHIFKWSYEKDLLGTNGSDTVWLDDIAFPLKASEYDFDMDTDVDGKDLAIFIKEYNLGNLNNNDIALFAKEFGR